MTQPARGLSCPKCRGAMSAYERNGITIDQCTECRGIFLDRGELERLIDAESAYYERVQPTVPVDRLGQQPTISSASEYPRQDREGHHGRSREGRDGQYRRKRGGLLSELFD